MQTLKGPLPMAEAGILAHANPTLTVSAQPGAVTIRSGRPVMAVEMLTYAALGERLGSSAEAARALVKRLRLPRQRRCAQGPHRDAGSRARQARSHCGRSPGGLRARARALQ